MSHTYNKRHLFIHSLSFSHLSTLRDDDRDLGPVVGSGRHVLHLPHDQESVNDPPEDDVLLVQEVALGARDEELAAVGVFARVGHGQQAWRVVSELEVLVLEGSTSAVDGVDSGAVIVYKVTA